MKWRVVLAIAQKDIADAFKNLYILFSLLLPVGMSLLLGFLMPGEAQVEHMPVVVYDPEGSHLVANLGRVAGVEILKVDSAEKVQTEVQDKGVGGFAVPAGFDAAIAAGQHPELTIYLNYKSGGGGVSRFEQVIADQVWALSGEPPIKISYFGVSPLPASDSPVGNFNMDDYLLGMFLVIGLTMAGVFVVPTLLVEEKEKHTLQALLVSPASAAEVVAGKALVGLFYCLLEAAILIVLSKGWSGNWPYTLAALILGSLFAVAVGLFMGGLFHTTHQVNTWSSILMLVLMMPSWLFVLGLPPAVAAVFRLIPTYYMSTVINLAFAGQATLEKVWPNLAILSGCIIATYAAVVYVVRRDTQRA